MNYYNEIKEQIINNEIINKVKDYSKNKSDLETYYNVGKLLSEAGKHYGESIIKEYSIKLTNDINKKYNTTTLKRMRQFYLMIEKGATLSHQLTPSHYIELIPLKNTNIINYYIELTKNYNLSIRELRFKIKNNEYERLPEDTKNKLNENHDKQVKDLVKDPIIIKNPNNKEIIKEKSLQKLILEDIPSFLEELGEGFTFIKNEYKIKLGSRYNYIDILLYNLKYKCYVVCELKVVELNSNHIGQIEKYINYINKNIKGIEDNKTIGIIICRKDNKYVIEYSSNENIIARTYRLV